MDFWIVAFVVALYANLPSLAGRWFGLAGVAGACVLGLLVVPAAVQVLVRRRGFVVDFTGLLLVAFTGVLLLVTLPARDPQLALSWIGSFVAEVLLVYFLILNAVRSRSTLRRAIWAVMITAAVLGGLSAVQELGGIPQQQFGGLAQRDLTRAPKEVAGDSGERRVALAHRALGPIGDPNRFAQVLVFALPLAAFRIRDERTRSRRILALVCTAAILGGIFCTYSRGAFFALALLVVLALFYRYLRVVHVVPALVLAAGLASVLAPGTIQRLRNLEAIPTLLSDRSFAQTDGAVRGRLTEMLAAWNVFVDHPFLGVGPRHYTRYYSVDYMGDPDVAFRQLARPRRAHSLYFEMAAETGILGVSVFLAAVGLLLFRLARLRRRWSGVRPELDHLAGGFLLAIAAYLATALFLHLSYQRYLGLLLGLAGAAVQVLTYTGAAQAAPESDSDSLAWSSPLSPASTSHS